MKCEKCNAEFKESDLSEVAEHMHTGHVVDANYNGILSGKKYTKEQSSNVKSISYDHDNSFMYVTFHNGNTYRYIDVPSLIFRQAVNSDSIGKFLSEKIKGFYRFENSSHEAASNAEEKPSRQSSAPKDVKNKLPLLG